MLWLAVASILLPSQAQAASVLDEWKALPRKVFACMKRMVEPVDGPIEGVIAAGVRPSASPYAPGMATCEKYADLRQSYECEVNDASGQVIATLCREYFAVLRNGTWTEIDPDTALDTIIGQREDVRLAFIETNDGLRRRQEQIAAELAARDEVDTDTSVEADPPAVPKQKPLEASEDPDAKATFHADWLLDDWCWGDLEKARAVNPDIKPLVLRCTAEQACYFQPNDRPWDNVEWTHTDANSAEFSLSSYGEKAGRLLMNVPDGVNGASYQCKVTKLGPDEISRVCDGGLYGEEKSGTSESYVRCSSLPSNKDTQSNVPAAVSVTPKQTSADQASSEAKWAYDAVFSCGMGGGSNTNIVACFIGSGGIDTELAVTRDGVQHIFKAYQLANIQSTDGYLSIPRNADIPDGMIIDSDGLHVLLPEHFSLTAQNSQEYLILGLTITEMSSGKVVAQREAGRFGVISIGN